MTIDKLPTDILLLIINNVRYYDLLNLLAVNKTINIFVKTNKNYIITDEIVDLNKIKNPKRTLTRFPNIKFYYSVKNNNKTLKCNDNIYKCNDNIYSLKLANCNNTDFSFLSNFHNLKILDLFGTNIDNVSLECIVNNVYNLTNLSLRNCDDIDDDGCILISNLHSLKILNLSFCYQITNIECLSNLVNLEKLYLNGTSITSIDVIRNFHNLTFLNLSGCDELYDNNFKYEIFNNLYNLKILDLSVCINITNLSFCSSLSSINTILLSKNNNISKESLAKLDSVNIYYL